MAKGNRPNPVAFAFELVSGLVFLMLLVYAAVVSSNFNSVFGRLVQVDNGFWLPIMYGLAAVGTVSLLAISFTNLTFENPTYNYAIHVSLLNGFAWMVLAAGNAPFTSLAGAAFGLSLVGSIIGLSQAAR